MKDPMEVLRLKEQELLRVKKEVDALRIVAKILGEEDTAADPRVDLRQVVKMP